MLADTLCDSRILWVDLALVLNPNICFSIAGATLVLLVVWSLVPIDQ